MLKQEIKNILVQFLVDKEILDSSALSLVFVTQTVNLSAFRAFVRFVLV